MIEVRITPEDQQGAAGQIAWYVKQRLLDAGIPVVMDLLDGMRFTEAGRLYADYAHDVTVFQWVPDGGGA